jgi:hypothetical protein
LFEEFTPACFVLACMWQAGFAGLKSFVFEMFEMFEMFEEFHS